MLTCLAKAELVSGVGDAGAHLREAVTLARKAGLDGALIEALLVNVRTSFDEEQQSDPEKIELLEHALALPGDTPARRARLLGALAVESIFVGDATRRGPLLDEALELARRSGDPRALVEVSAGRFLARPRSTWSAAQFKADRPLFGEAVDAAAILGDPVAVATTQTHAAFGALIAGDGEQLRTHTAALSQTAAGGQNQIAFRAELLLGQCIATLEGRLVDAEALSREVSDTWRMTGLAETAAGRAVAHIALRREQSRLPELIAALTTGGARRALLPPRPRRPRPMRWSSPEPATMPPSSCTGPTTPASTTSPTMSTGRWRWPCGQRSPHGSVIATRRRRSTRSSDPMTGPRCVRVRWAAARRRGCWPSWRTCSAVRPTPIGISPRPSPSAVDS